MFVEKQPDKIKKKKGNSNGINKKNVCYYY
jgi:hypothetical protein